MAGRALQRMSHQGDAKCRGVVLCTCAVESMCPGQTTPIAHELRTLQLQLENGSNALEIVVVSHKATSASTLRPSHPSPRGPRKRKYLHTDLYRNDNFGTFLLVQWLRIHPSVQLDAGSSPSRGTKVLHVAEQLSPVHCYWSQNPATGRPMHHSERAHTRQPRPAENKNKIQINEHMKIRMAALAIVIAN